MEELKGREREAILMKWGRVDKRDRGRECVCGDEWLYECACMSACVC